MNLTGSQKAALTLIAAAMPNALHGENAWTAATSLARFGLVTKLPAGPIAALVYVWGAEPTRIISEARTGRAVNGAFYQLTEAGVVEAARVADLAVKHAARAARSGK